MAIESIPGGGHMITGERDIAVVRLLALRSALGLEIRTGMQRSSRGRSTLTIVQSMGITNKRTKKGAYQDLNAHIVANGGPDRPLT
jgi:hypothetical protein